MTQISIPKRFFICGAVFFIPLAIVVYFYVQSMLGQINFTKSEIKGIRYIAPLVSVQQALAEHQFEWLARHGNGVDTTAQLVKESTLVRDGLNKLQIIDNEVGADLEFTAEGLAKRERSEFTAANLVKRWESIEELAKKSESFVALQEEYTGMQQAIRAMISHASDNSNLTLDPDLDSYYLMDTTAMAIPQAINRLSKLANDLIGANANIGALDEEEIKKLHAYQFSLKEDDDARIAASIKTAFDEDSNYYHTSATLRPTLEPLLALLSASYNNLDVLLKEGDRDGRLDTVTFTNALKDTNTKLLTVFGGAATELEGMFEERIYNYEKQVFTVLGFLGLSLAVAVGIFYVVSRSITHPLKDLQKAMVELAGGNLERDIPHTAKGDEIGQMAKTLLTFRETSREAKKMEAAKLSESTAQAERQKQVEQLVMGFEGKVSELLQQTAASAQAMHSTTESMVNDAHQTSERTQLTVSATRDTTNNVAAIAAAAEELSASISEISRQVLRSTSVTQEAVEKTQSADGTVNQLNEAAQKIGEIIDLISSIAEQINLLALNATIESARAGEAGKGFAVVAAEVKNLANQTSKATEAIASQINEVQSVVGNVVASLTQIRGTIDQMSGISTTIASAVEEQGAATQEIARNIQTTSDRVAVVSENIVQVGSMSEQTTNNAQGVLDSVKSFSKQSNALQREIEMFLGEIAKAS